VAEIRRLREEGLARISDIKNRISDLEMQLSECATEVSRPSEVSVELSASPVLAVTFDD